MEIMTTSTKAYLNTQVQTADRLELLIALYEGAMGFVRSAVEGIEENDLLKRSTGIGRAADIITYLCEVLDYSQPGVVAGNLFAMYNYQLRLLIQANRENDSEPLETVYSTLSILLNGWREIASSPEAAAVIQADRKRMMTGYSGAEDGRQVLALSA
jgi:flagellar secretion chaperone FliS